MRRLSVFLALAVVDASALIGLRPDVDVLCRGLAAPHAWIATDGADRAALTVACAVLWAAAVWLALGLAASAASTLPGACGRASRRVAGTLLPAVVYRAAAGVAGVGVVLAPVAAVAQPTTPPSAASSSASLPAPAWPTEPTETPPPAEARPPADALQPAETVVVRPGDSLWRIAAQRLGPAATPARVAAAWPRWYAANRATIGGDPDLIQVGEALRAPAEDGS